jgi:hypothetical protein
MAIFIRDNDSFAILDCEISCKKLRRECATSSPGHPRGTPTASKIMTKDTLSFQDNVIFGVQNCSHQSETNTSLKLTVRYDEKLLNVILKPTSYQVCQVYFRPKC